MARVAWRRGALIELDLIRAYIRQFDPDADAAERLARRLREAGDSLRDFPNRGRLSTNGRRELVTVPPYLIRYRVNGDLVVITDIKHSARRPD